MQSDFGDEERSIQEILDQGVVATSGLSPTLLAEFLHKLVGLQMLSPLVAFTLVHDLQKLKICGEEDVGGSPINQIGWIVFLLAGLLPLMGDDRCEDARYQTGKIIEIADDEMVVGN